MKKEFKYYFQITKLVMFEVEYYTLGNNKSPYFTTSASKFFRNKKIMNVADKPKMKSYQKIQSRDNFGKNGIKNISKIYQTMNIER